MKVSMNPIFGCFSRSSTLAGATLAGAILVLLPVASLADEAPVESMNPTVEARGVMQKMEDTAITFRVSNLIEHNKEVSDGTEINVTTVNAIVLLTGNIKNAEDKRWCEETVASHPKVRKVINELKVQKMRDVVALAKDKALQASVKVRVVAELDAESPTVHVIVYGKTVYLMGVVSRDVADRAVQVARKTRSVDRVITIFQFKEEAQAS